MDALFSIPHLQTLRNRRKTKRASVRAVRIRADAPNTLDMLLGIATIVCIVVFVICAFALRYRMHTLSAVYEAETKALFAAELAVREGGMPLDPRRLERGVREAARHARVMRANAVLFRLLWPQEYDRAFYAAQRLLAQSTHLASLGSR